MRRKATQRAVAQSLAGIQLTNSSRRAADGGGVMAAVDRTDEFQGLVTALRDHVREATVR